jgi:hypothetical protein
MTDPRGPAVAAAPPGQPPAMAPDIGGNPNAPQGQGSQGQGMMGGPGDPVPGDQPPKKPLYKKWWFWAIAGVAAIVVYDIASTEPSTRSRSNGLQLAPQPTGMTLMRW